MLLYLLRQQIRFAPLGLLGLGAAMIYFVVKNQWAAAGVLSLVAVAGLAQFVAARLWLKWIEDRDLREWQRENPET